MNLQAILAEFRNHRARLAAALPLLLILFCAAVARADGTKTVSGKLKTVKDNVVTLKKEGLASSAEIEIEMNEHTKVSGQVLQGMHAKIKYREEAASGGKGEPRRIALEIETTPERASKQAKEVSGASPPPKKDHP